MILSFYIRSSNQTHGAFGPAATLVPGLNVYRALSVPGAFANQTFHIVEDSMAEQYANIPSVIDFSNLRISLKPIIRPNTDKMNTQNELWTSKSSIPQCKVQACRSQSLSSTANPKFKNEVVTKTSRARMI